MVVKIYVSCLKGQEGWFFDENSTISDIVEQAIKFFEFKKEGLYELWKSTKDDQLVLDFRKKIKDCKINSDEVLHFIDLTFTIEPKKNIKSKS